MSAGEDRKPPHEVVIIRRRRGGHDEGHHGGAWKIAFADFMTALMCFFLVMWLINSTDKKTLTQVATYFNPMRLNDRTASQKGPNEPAPTAAGEKSEEKDKAKAKAASKAEKAKKDAAGAASSAAKDGPPQDAAGAVAAERELFRDPYGVLERIMSGEASPAATSVHPRVPPISAAPRDLFDLTQKRAGGGGTPKPDPAPDHKVDEAAGAIEGARQAPLDLDQTSIGKTDPPRDASPDAVPEPHWFDEPQTLQVRIEREIRDALAGLEPGLRPHVEVIDLEHEILISLMDEFDFAMFAVASARPTRELVHLMERIGHALARSEEHVTIRGHTDARHYRTAGYDNWRLSTARAQTAFYILVRGGLQESRVKRIEGHADRSLKVAGEPLAAQNRRIEILVRKSPK